ncbi:hypothetical protein [Roseomonas indoligenes]|uniref:Uncharacterized protein n=1 Tax=Roseomonas indoligenes TaxID=2820811 RepID=A0A940MXK5_9PROT|nr:hypothetical protein [Pararoseomonas indoligenes]MBP0493956.1 hypothetical protein [Pararoseomonas indoligenes]
MAQEIRDYPTNESDYLPHVIARCVEKANRYGIPHRFRLNGAEVVVRPGKTAEEVNEEVQRQWQAARALPSMPQGESASAMF